MQYNKVIVDNEVIIDLTQDTVTPQALLLGVQAHDSTGAVIVGTMPDDAVRYGPQTPTESESKQARLNIKAIGQSDYALGDHLGKTTPEGAPTQIYVKVDDPNNQASPVSQSKMDAVVGNINILLETI